MAEVGSVWVEIGMKADGFMKSFNQVDASLGKLNTAAKNTASNMKALGTSLTLKVAAPLMLISGLALKSAISIEQYSIAFENLYGSAEAAGDELVYLLNFAKKTPFQITGLVAADKRLSAFGINAREVLVTLGNTASALGVPLMQSVEAFADAQTGEFERLKEFGIKAIEVTNSNYEALGVGAEAAGKTALSYTDKLGKQRVEIVDRNNSDIVSSTLLSIWNSKYASAMEMQSKSLAGIGSNIKDNFTVAGLSILGFNKATGQFTDDSLFMSIKRVSEAAASLSESFTELSPTTQKIIIGITALGIAIPTVILAVGVLSTAFSAGASILSTALLPAIGMIIPVLSTVGAPLLLVGGLVYALEKKFSLFSDTATILWDVLKTKIVPVVKSQLTAAFEKMKSTISKLMESLQSLLEPLVEFAGMGGKVGSFLDSWHQKAEAIRQKNEELAKSNEELADSVTGVGDAYSDTGEQMSEVDSEIPGYAGHTRDLIAAGMAEQAGFAGGMRDNATLAGYGDSLAPVQPSPTVLKDDNTKEIAKNTNETNSILVSTKASIFTASQDLQKAIRESKSSSSGFSGFVRRTPI